MNEAHDDRDVPSEALRIFEEMKNGPNRNHLVAEFFIHAADEMRRGPSLRLRMLVMQMFNVLAGDEAEKRDNLAKLRKRTSNNSPIATSVLGLMGAVRRGRSVRPESYRQNLEIKSEVETQRALISEGRKATTARARAKRQSRGVVLPKKDPMMDFAEVAKEHSISPDAVRKRVSQAIGKRRPGRPPK